MRCEVDNLDQQARRLTDNIHYVIQLLKGESSSFRLCLLCNFAWMLQNLLLCYACAIVVKHNVFCWSALSAWQVFDNFESGLEPLFPAKAQSSSTPSTMEVGRDWEGRGGVLVAEGEGQSSRSGRKRRCDDNDGSYNSTDGKRSDINDDEQSAGAAPPQAKMKKDKDILHDEEGDAKANKKKKGKRWRKKAKKYPYKVLHQ